MLRGAIRTRLRCRHAGGATTCSSALASLTWTGRRVRREAALRTQHRHRRDRVVRRRRGSSTSPATGSWRSSRPSTARSSTTTAGACSARARRPRGASTRPAWSPTSTATARRRSWSAATRARWRPTTARCASSGAPRRAAAGSAPRRAGWPPATSTATAGSRWWPPRRTPRGTARRSSSSTRPANVAPGWPRYNASDADFNGVGNQGYGAYGENVGVGQVDGDPQLEVVVTYDNHQINLFNHDGTSVLASPWYTNRQNEFTGRRLGWGQFIRWLSPKVEDDHYHRHVGEWPHPRGTGVAAVDGLAAGDRRPRPRRPQRGDRPAQRREERALRDAGLRVHGARRRVRRGEPVRSPAQGVPAPAADAQAGSPPRRRLVPAERDPGPHDREPARQPPARDRRLGARRGRLRGRPGRPAAVALRLRARQAEDVRLRGRRGRPQRDGRPELVFGAYGLAPRSGRLVVLSARGRKLHDIRLRNQGTNGNGIGIPAAPSIGRPRRRRAARDRGHHLRPRDRRLPRPPLEREELAVADRPREPAAEWVIAGENDSSEAKLAEFGRAYAAALLAGDEVAAELVDPRSAGGGPRHAGHRRRDHRPGALARRRTVGARRDLDRRRAPGHRDLAARAGALARGPARLAGPARAPGAARRAHRPSCTSWPCA